MQTTTWRRGLAVLAAVAVLTAGCSGSDDDGDDGAAEAKATGTYTTDLDVQVDPDEETAPATFEVRPGTEEVTVTGLEPDERISLVDADGRRLVVLRADRFGQAHAAYLPDLLAEYPTGGRAELPTADGITVEAGDGYTVRREDTEPVEVTEAFTVLGRDDHPDAAFFDDQVGTIGPSGDETSWFGYLTTRDGVQLSVKVDLPGPADEGPYPTVVEYSGYGITNPDRTEPGSLIAGLLGYATVGVNMRGTGCSGGVFDVFNTAQQVDGYDAVEAVARQPWVAGNEVGMVGLSYSGITQLYVAATAPPSLAAVTPLSVIKDPWLQQWPGGVYNGGFTREWIAQREAQSAPGGSSWVDELVDAGDDVCASHLELREQNIDFEAFGRSLERRPALADDRDLSKLVASIEVPVFLTGAWQDEQTGPQFADMLGNFTDAPVTRFTLFNGRHPDGYTPLLLSRWWEFLELYVAGEVPRIAPGLREAAPALFESEFGTRLEFEPDRFTDYDDDQYDEVLAVYEAEPPVRVLFDMGAGGEVAGAPVFSYEQSYDTWPPADLGQRVFHLDADGTLSADEPDEEGVDTYANDLDSGTVDFFGDEGYELQALTWDLDWTTFDDGDAVSYLSEPFAEDQVLGGAGYAELHLRVPDGDADVQVTLGLVDADDTEWLVTTGLLRLSDRAFTADGPGGLQTLRTHAADDAEEMPADAFEPARVAFPSFAQTFRAGERLKVTVSSPGRDFGAWTFEATGDDGTPRDIARGPGLSRIVLGELPGVTEVPDIDTPCPSLRGQACRPFAGASS